VGPVTARTDSPAPPGSDTGKTGRPERGRRRGRPVPEEAEPELRGADKPRGDLQAPPARPARTGAKPRPAKVSRKEAKARAAASAATATTAARAASVASAATRVAPAPASVAVPPAAASPAAAPETKAPAPARKQAPVAVPKAGRAKKRRRRRVAFAVTAGAGCAAAAVVASQVLTGSAQAHSITTPTRLGDYVQAPALATGMGASTLRSKIVASSNGEASHVLDAVYEDSTGPAAKAGPLIILFVGGNLTGSASSFIQSLTQTLSGAFVTSAGRLPGQAACVPSAAGRLAECAWADNDTFGVIASPVLSATALASELRQMRPQLEHARKK
jgi:hypothetical protein